jgi:UDP-galactopyranose mutase
MWTFNKLWGVTHPDEARKIIEEQSRGIEEPTNLEEQAIKLVGKDVYEKLIKGYTEKQWRKPAQDLPASIIKRLPVRFTYDSSYFNDTYQGIPIGGYTQIFEKLLNDIEVILGVDYLKGKEYWDTKADKVIYTGPIDAYYNYKFGELEYKTTRFEHFEMYKKDCQGVAMMNYTDKKVPHTRIIEHKHFDPVDVEYTYVTFEYPVEYDSKTTEPMYPVNDGSNNAIYGKYAELASKEVSTYFGGRLAEYKYYDMHQVIESALNFIKTLV